MGNSTSLPRFSSGTPASTFADSWKNTLHSAAEKSSSSSCLIDDNVNHGQKLNEADGTALALNLSTNVGENLLNALPSSMSSLSALHKNSPVKQCEEIRRPCSDSVVLSCAYVTKRKKGKRGLSAAFGADSSMRPSDNLSVDGLQWTKKTEAAVNKPLDISQVGELVTLSTKNKSYEKYKANKTKALRKVSTGTVDRDVSISQSRGNVDSHSNGQVDPAELSETSKLHNSKGNMLKPAYPAEDSSRVDSLEEIVPLDSHGSKEKHNSQHSDKTRRSSLADPALPDHVNSCNSFTQTIKKKIFLEKMKNLEGQFQSPETNSLHNKQGEDSHGCVVTHTSQDPKKATACRRRYAVDLGLPDDENVCTSFAHEIRKSTLTENFEDLESWFQNPESSSFNSQNSQHTFNTQHFMSSQTQIPSQEATLGLNVKRKKPKRKTQEIVVSHSLGEIDVQSLDVNRQSHTQPQESKTQKGPSKKAAQLDRENSQKEYCRTDVNVFYLSEDVNRRVNKKKDKTSRISLKLMSQRSTTSLASVGSTPPVFPVLLEIEDSGLHSVHKNSAKVIPKVQQSSVTPDSCTLNKTNSSPSERTDRGVDSHAIDIKKKTMTKLKKKAYTVKYVTEECASSDDDAQGPEECETSEADKAGSNFLRVPSSRTQQDSPIMGLTEAPTVFDSFTKCPSTSDSSSVYRSEVVVSSCWSSGSSCSVFPASKDQGSSERCHLPKSLTTLKKNEAEQLASCRQRRKTERATSDTFAQENENKVLKDLTNASPDSCHSIILEGSPIHPTRRRKKQVSYAEPKINSKLRRGDPFTITDFLSSPIYKTKRKKLSKGSGKSRKAKEIYQEEVQPTSSFMTIP
ncbi:uncharacterized protein LOC123024361 isoform X3 [Varanus komodoensis]|nr:uncharacterized protein LOC123024361 isoform X3 [Varanus komodoensis]